MNTRFRILLAALLFAVTTVPASAAYSYDVTIVNPLPTRVWLTVYLGPTIRYSNWLRGSLHYQTHSAAMRVMAEIAKPEDRSADPAKLCKTAMNMEHGYKVVTIRYNPDNRSCWWDYKY